MSSKKLKAIVIDDDIDTVELFSEYLEQHDIQVIGEGYDGKQAVEIYEKLKPDISFIDLMMPYYDGFYAILGIRQIDPNAKIIMVTADLTEDSAQKFENLNTQVIYKPFEFEDLASTIDRMFNSKPVAA
jgi:DNA-binding response OmpR family regulator